MKRYYFLIASKNFLLYQEPIEEILRERIRHYDVIKKDIDFCFTTDLGFLDLPDLQEIKSRLVIPSAAILSLNPTFINWLKLRMNYGVTGSFTSTSVNQFSNIIISN